MVLRRGQATVLTYHSDVVRQRSIMRFYRSVLVRRPGGGGRDHRRSHPCRRAAICEPIGNKLHLIPYGIPLARFQEPPATGQLARLRSTYGAVLHSSRTPAGCLLLFVGRCATTRDWTT